MKRDEVLSCAFSSWYPHFKEFTWPSIIVPLSDEFVSYLLADGLVLPTVTHSCVGNNDEQKRDDEDDDSENWNEDNDEVAQAPQFDELDEEIRRAVKTMGGGVFPKLNWSSPKDAVWISLNHSLKCVTPSDVYLLLKSSDFISHDLTQPFKDCEHQPEIDDHHKVKYELVLKKWIDVNPAMEFRCFVKNSKLIGICQRDITNYYSHIGHQQKEIVSDIVLFYEKRIRHKFPLENYVFDVYRESKNNVKLIDFNPFGPTTDDLLFSWNSLLSRESDVNEPEFRYVTETIGVQPDPYRYYAVPKDVVDLGTGLDSYKLIDLLRVQSNCHNSG